MSENLFHLVPATAVKAVSENIGGDSPVSMFHQIGLITSVDESLIRTAACPRPMGTTLSEGDCSIKKIAARET
jgi:hypothetical protein